MKSIKIIIVLAFVLPVLNLSAQDLRPGAHFGIGEVSLDGNFENSSSRLFLSAGGTYDYEVNRNLSLTAHLLGTFQGLRYSDATEEQGVFGTESYGYTQDLDLFYAELPMLVNLQFGGKNLKFRGFGGYSLGYRLMALSTRTYDDANYNQDHGYVGKRANGVNAANHNLIYGVGLMSGTASGQAYYIRFQVSENIKPFARINGDDATTKSAGVHVGYLF